MYWDTTYNFSNLPIISELQTWNSVTNISHCDSKYIEEIERNSGELESQILDIPLDCSTTGRTR